MCGIIGYISKTNEIGLGEIAYIGLEMLQHRGQDAAGIYTFEGQLIKGSGSVDHVFNKYVIGSIKGHGFIGQTRYPTTKSKDEAQPLENRICAMVHNGHINNLEEIINKYKNPRINSGIDLIAFFSIFDTIVSNGTDKELIEFSRRAMSELKGAFSLLGIIKNRLIFALRDPYGIRPLFYSEDGNKFAIASETIALEKLGFNNFYELERGSLLIIDKNLNIRHFKIMESEEKFCSFELVYFSRTTSRYRGKQIFEYREKLGEKLCEIFLEEHRGISFNNTIVAPVPETSRAAAEGFHKKLGEIGYNVPMINILEKHRYGGRNFIKPSEEIRRKQVFYTLTPIEKNVKGMKIILIDDSIVRGTTSRKIIKLLREKGAKEIHLAVTFPKIAYSCFYGIDTPTRQELIGSFNNKEEIAKMIGVDSLTYMSVNGLKEVLGDKICHACVDGSYVNL